MKKYIDYIILSIVVLCSSIVCIFTLPYNIDSLCDEGYLWLVVKAAMDGNVGGGSLWANMLVAFLGEKICSSILSLRIANVVCAMVSALLFWLITHRLVSKTKISSIAYLVLILFVLPIGGIILCYNGITRLFLLLVCAALIRILTSNNGKGDSLWALLIGFAIMLSLFSILPSAVMIGVAVVALLVIKYWKQWKKLLMLLCMMVLGIVCGLVMTHLFVADLRVVYGSMMETAQTITKVNRGYDPLSFIVAILLFFRDYSLFLLLSIGIILASYYLKRNGFSWLSSVFFIASCLVYWHYQKKPTISYSMELSLLWLLPVIDKWHEKQLPPIKQLLTMDFAINLFLLFFPLLAAMGTNVYLGSKMGWFMVPWVLLGCRLGFGERKMQFRREALIALSIMALFGVYRQFRTIDRSQTVVERGSLKGMHLNARQEEHFKVVDQIMDDYQFQRGESVVFATQLSMMTVCYLEALPVGLYFQPNDFVVHADEPLPIPNYLFLCEYDTIVAKECLEKMPWGWPQEFDVYEIGSPDDDSQTVYPIGQSLYCRRSLRN